MNARDRLREIIDALQGRIAAGVVPDREAALPALVKQIDGTPTNRLAGPCLGAATALCRGLAGTASNDAGDPGSWAVGLLPASREIEAARLVLRFAEAGEMRLTAGPDGAFEARLAGDRLPSLWRERIDMAALTGSTTSHLGAGSQSADMRCHLPYIADGEICGIPVPACREVLAGLMRIGAVPRDAGGDVPVFDERHLVGDVAAMAAPPADIVEEVLSALTLDAGNCAWHAALAGGPLAPLVRVSANRIALCRRGLETEPLVFLTRELRRRDPERYHNGAHQRVTAFRSDLNALFAERRFVTSADRIVLRRDDRRNRTDVDAAIFDRKTGTLALFELKSHDPFARTPAELERQREALNHAGRQIAAVLDWINRHGADEVLNRMDRATAKRFRVQRVLPFVLGRYLGGAGAGRSVRVAWGSWGQAVRLVRESDGDNGLLALHDRLNDTVRDVPVALPARIRLGDASIAVRGGWEG